MPGPVIYFVETRSIEQRTLLCRWVEHFYDQGKKVQVVVDSTMAARHLDGMLWTYAQGSFIPHGTYDSTISPVPGEVLITVGEVMLASYEALVADGPVSLDFVEHFRWVVHFVLLDDTERRQESRLLWQQARERGLTVQHIAQGKMAPFPVLSG